MILIPIPNSDKEEREGPVSKRSSERACRWGRKSYKKFLFVFSK